MIKIELTNSGECYALARYGVYEMGLDSGASAYWVVDGSAGGGSRHGNARGESLYERYDIQQQLTGWAEQILPLSLLSLVAFIRQHLQGLPIILQIQKEYWWSTYCWSFVNQCFRCILLQLHDIRRKRCTCNNELGNLNTTSTLASTSGIFIIGFFTISSTNFTYLGIWYTNKNQDWKVWIANRNIPIIDDRVLMIDDSWTLKVVNGGGATFFNVFNDQVGSNDTRGVLRNSENFLVYDEANHTLWQSFDLPINILRHGMKIGYNLTSRLNWTLKLLWSSDHVPATGAFTTRLEEIQNIYSYSYI
jgi:hypothetical protein